MERNRIQEFLLELPDVDHASRFGSADAATAEPPSSFVAIPQALWAELGADQRAQYLWIYREAFMQAEAQIRRECVDRLLESLTTP